MDQHIFVGDHNSKVGRDQPGTFSEPYQHKPINRMISHKENGLKASNFKMKLIAGGPSSAYIWNTYPTTPNQQPSITLRNYYSNGDGDVVFAGGRLYVNNYNGNNVQVYNSLQSLDNNPILQSGLHHPAEYAFSINYIQNPVVATDGNILLASSDFDAQLWIWKTIPTISGKVPDIKIPLRTPTFDIAPWDNASNNQLLA